MSAEIDFSLFVSVFLKRTEVEANQWLNERWEALGVTLADTSIDLTEKIVLDHEQIQIYQYQGLKIDICYDEMESYYQNIRAENAGVFIVCRQNNESRPVPFLVTLSYDEAAAYMETDEIVYSVEIPAPIYVKLEKFVLDNYQPKQFKKRKLIKGDVAQNYKEESSFE